jgi:tetraacyldisaccharide 4'-kinase
VDQKRKKTNSRKLSLPVVSIGNLTVGGTGKTPLLIKMISDLLALHHQPAVLSRGYGQSTKQSESVICDEKNLDKFESSDEIQLLRQKFPQVVLGVGPDRTASAKKIQERSDVDLFILDDGFQHRQIKRDLDVLCVDATDPWGGGFLLPLGRLRESTDSLARAHVVVLTRTELVSSEQIERIKNKIREISSAVLVLVSNFQFSIFNANENKDTPENLLSGKDVILLSALANPQAFEENVRKLGAQTEHIRYPDHHEYSKRELESAFIHARKRNKTMVTTEKDWMKIKSEFDSLKDIAQLLVLKNKVVFSYGDEDRWLSLLKSLPFK